MTEAGGLIVNGFDGMVMKSQDLKTRIRKLGTRMLGLVSRSFTIKAA